MFLTEAELQQFETNGFHVFTNAVGPELCTRLEYAADLWIDSRSTWNLEHVPDTIGYRDCINQDPAFRELLTIDSVFPGVVQILGTNIRLIGSQVIYVPTVSLEINGTAGSGSSAPQGQHGVSGVGWHQDLYSVTRDFDPTALPRLALKIMYYLTDCLSPQSGMTLFAKGSHRKDYRVIKEEGIDANDVAIPIVRRGDAVIFENRTFHAAGRNVSPQTRKAVALQYGFRWLAPLYDIDYSIEMLEACTDIERQLLGGTHDRSPDGSIGRGVATAPLHRWAEKRGLQTRQDRRTRM